MKSIATILLAIVTAIATASAAFSEKSLEAAKKAAASKGKLVAFFIERPYYDPNCPTCIATVDADNNAIKKAIPRKYVQLITIDAGDARNLAKLPACVIKSRKIDPQIILTDAACESVIATIEGRPERKEAAEFEKKAAEALGKK